MAGLAVAGDAVALATGAAGVGGAATAAAAGGATMALFPSRSSWCRLSARRSRLRASSVFCRSTVSESTAAAAIAIEAELLGVLSRSLLQ